MCIDIMCDVHMGARYRFPVAVDSITIPGQIDAACKKGEDFNAHINTICNDIHQFYGMRIVTLKIVTLCTATYPPQRTPPVKPECDGG